MERPTGPAAKQSHRRPSPAINGHQEVTETTDSHKPCVSVNRSRPSSSSSQTPRRSSLPTSTASPQPRLNSEDPTMRRKRSLKSPSPALSPADQMLQSLRKHLDHVRQIITCNICYDLLYEPYTTSCGHTYCYSCLCQAFAETKATRCPECREPLLQAPAPAYLVREITHSYLKNSDLLPPDETLTELLEKQARSADDIRADKANTDKKHGGLFKGKFRTKIRRPRAIVDATDGVTRCPYCNWELEGGMCIHCHLPFDTGASDWSDGWTISSSATSDTPGRAGSQDIDDDGNFGAMGGIDIEVHDPADFIEQQEWYDRFNEFSGDEQSRAAEFRRLRERSIAGHSATFGRRRSYPASGWSDTHSSEVGTIEEEDEDEGDADSEMNDFINDEEGIDAASEASDATSSLGSEESRLETSYLQAQVSSPPRRQNYAASRSNPQILGRRRRPIIEEDTPESTPMPGNQADDEDGDDAGPIMPRNRRQRTYQSPSTASSRSTRSIPTHRRTPAASFSPQIDTQSGTDLSSQRSSRSQSVQTDQTGGFGYGEYDEEGLEDDEGEEDGSDDTIDGLAQDPTPTSRPSNERTLTAVPDRPQITHRPSVIRHSSSRANLGSTLRRQRSVLSAAPSHQEDGDADDENGIPASITATARPAVQRAPSVIHINRLDPPRRSGADRLIGQQSLSESVDVDSDDSITSSLAGSIASQGRYQRQNYNNAVGDLFNRHLHDDVIDPTAALRDMGPEMRRLARTPLARPRIANRNRLQTQPSSSRLTVTTPAGVSEPFRPPSRVRTSEQAVLSSNPARPVITRIHSNASRAPSRLQSRSSLRAASGQAGTASAPDGSVNTQASPTSQVLPASRGPVGGFISRPSSRVSNRSNYSGSTLVSSNVGSGPNSGYSASLGLHTARDFQTRNPFSRSISQALNPHFVYTELNHRPSRYLRDTQTQAQGVAAQQTGIRPRQSSHSLRNRESSRTIRSRPSANLVSPSNIPPARSVVAEATIVPIIVPVSAPRPVLHVQASRQALRSQVSHRQINYQAPAHTSFVGHAGSGRQARPQLTAQAASTRTLEAVDSQTEGSDSGEETDRAETQTTRLASLRATIRRDSQQERRPSLTTAVNRTAAAASRSSSAQPIQGMPTPSAVVRTYPNLRVTGALRTISAELVAPSNVPSRPLTEVTTSRPRQGGAQAMLADQLQDSRPRAIGIRLPLNHQSEHNLEHGRRVSALPSSSAVRV